MYIDQNHLQSKENKKSQYREEGEPPVETISRRGEGETKNHHSGGAPLQQFIVTLIEIKERGEGEPHRLKPKHY